MKFRFPPTALALVSLLSLRAPVALAHCDTLDGPVVEDARTAFESKDVAPVLKWVGPDQEGEIRKAFEHALVVRALGPDARALAERFFLETLVRLHREGEGAPYTGLKPAGIEIDPAVVGADRALETGSVDALAKRLVGEVDQGLRGRHARVLETRKHAAESVAKGRAYVAAYVEFVHYAERLARDAASAASHGEHAAAPATHEPAAHAH